MPENCQKRFMKLKNTHWGSAQPYIRCYKKTQNSIALSWAGISGKT